LAFTLPAVLREAPLSAEGFFTLPSVLREAPLKDDFATGLDFTFALAFTLVSEVADTLVELFLKLKSRTRALLFSAFTQRKSTPSFGSGPSRPISVHLFVFYTKVYCFLSELFGPALFQKQALSHW